MLVAKTFAKNKTAAEKSAINENKNTDLKKQNKKSGKIHIFRRKTFHGDWQNGELKPTDAYPVGKSTVGYFSAESELSPRWRLMCALHLSFR